MAQSTNDYGTLNPKAAPELSRFAFLIGSWKCEAKLLSPDGTWQKFMAAWLGHYILDGYAIADEYRTFARMRLPNGPGIFVGSMVWQEIGRISYRRN